MVTVATEVWRYPRPIYPVQATAQRQLTQRKYPRNISNHANYERLPTQTVHTIIENPQNHALPNARFVKYKIDFDNLDLE